MIQEQARQSLLNCQAILRAGGANWPSPAPHQHGRWRTTRQPPSDRQVVLLRKHLTRVRTERRVAQSALHPSVGTVLSVQRPLRSGGADEGSECSYFWGFDWYDASVDYPCKVAKFKYAISYNGHPVMS